VEIKRERWSSRPAFIMAAIGSAVGLGNLWRFPYVAYENGGGAFLIPYFIAMLTAGIPMMILEYGLGHIMQGSAPAAASRVDRRLEWVGWWALLVGTMIVLYYAAVMAWCWVYTWQSLKALVGGIVGSAASVIPWGDSPETVSGFFFGKVLHLSSGPSELGGLSWPVVIGMVLTWLAVFLIIHRGVKRVGRVVLITVPLPIILIIILMIRGMTLPGSIEGLKYYLTPDFSKLKDPSVWLAAYSQIFFSLSLGFGILIAYASYLPKTTDVNNSAFITVLANCGTSFLAGFAVFSTLGYLAGALNVPVSEVVKSGPTLAFVTYPTAISKMPLPALFGVIFFITLLTLGIDSAFSIVEGVVGGIWDKWKINRTKLTAGFCLIGLFVGLIYCTHAGLYWLDIVDHWMNNFGLAAVGLLECIMIGYFAKPSEFRRYVNSVSEIRIGWWWDAMIRYVTPAILLYSLFMGYVQELRVPYEGYDGWALKVGGWHLVIALIIVAVLLSLSRGREVE